MAQNHILTHLRIFVEVDSTGGSILRGAEGRIGADGNLEES